MGSALCTAHASNASVALSFEEDYIKPGETLHLTSENANLSDYYLAWFVGDGMLNSHGTSYTVKDSDIEKIIKVQAYDGDEVVGETVMLCSDLPVVYINTENNQNVESKDDYINAEIRIQGSDKYSPETTTLYQGAAEIKGHGNSTWKWFSKKPYKLKLDKSTSLFDLGKNKHWLLIANYIDESCMRNQTSVQIAKTLDADYMDALWVDVVFNGEHQGNYQLFEQVRVSKDRVNVTDWEDEAENAGKAIAKAIAKKQAKDEGLDSEAQSELEKKIKDDLKTQMCETDMSWMSSGVVTYGGKQYTVSDYYSLPENNSGGYLFEMDYGMDEVSKFYTNRQVPVMFKSPEFICTDSATMNVAKEYIQSFEDALYSVDHNANGKSYTDLCYIDSAIPFWLTSEIMFNEAGHKSTYFYKEINDKIRFGPVWDFDWSSNNVAPFGSRNQNQKGWFLTDRWWFSEMMKDPYFAVKAKELYQNKYSELMDLIENEDYLSQWHDYISSSAAKNEELWYYSRGFENDYHALRTWIHERTDWINTQFASDDKAVTSLGATLSPNIQLNVSGDCYAGGSAKNFYVLDGNLTLQGNVTGDYSAAKIYINSKYVGSVPIASDANGNTFQYKLPTGVFTEEKGTKNVITVWVADANGNLSEMQYLTVTMRDSNTNLRTVSFMDYGDIETVYTVPAGKKIFVPDSLQAHTSKEFSGWINEVDSNQVLQAGKAFTVTEDCSFKASFVPCSNSEDHSWVKFNDGLQCKNCGITKGDDGVYTDIRNCTVNQSSRYNTLFRGEETGPKITVVYNGIELTEGVEYTISYKNNINAGFATYIITGIKDAGFDGVSEMSYRIVPRSVANSYVKISLDKDVYEYTGKKVEPVVTLKLFGNIYEEGKDYTVEYKDNVKAGTGSIIITGHGNFTGTVDKTFKIAYAVTPQNLTVTSKNCNSCTLKWDKVDQATGYRVYRSTDKDSGYTAIKKIKTNDPSFTDKTVVPGKKYYYKVSSYKTVGEESYSSAKTSAVKCTVKKITINGVTATKNTYNSIRISWTKTSGATGYKIYRSADKDGTFKLISTVGNVSSYVDKNLTPGKTYYYKVRATVKVDGKTYSSAQSAYVSQTAAPRAITNVTAKNVKTKSVKLSWDRSSPITGYKIYRKTGKTGEYALIATVKGSDITEYKDTKLTLNKTYYYVVRAYRLVNGECLNGQCSSSINIKITK